MKKYKMNFYIKTFICNASLEDYGSYDSLPFLTEDHSILITPPDHYPLNGTIKIISSDPSTKYMLGLSQHIFPNSLPRMYPYGEAWAWPWISEYTRVDYNSASIGFSYTYPPSQGYDYSYCVDSWGEYGWNTRDINTFTEQLCNSFYNSLEGNTGSFGNDPVDTTLYLYILSMGDIVYNPTHLLPVFMKRNDQAYDHIYVVT